MGLSVIGVFRWLALVHLVMIGSEYGGAALLAGPSSSVGLFSGRPGTQSVEDFEDRLLAAYAKAKSKDKKLTEADFLLQLPAYLEHEALQLWRKRRKDILTKPEGASDRDWDPIADVIALFKEHFGVASAAKVRELQTLKKREDETCRMLRSRLERLAEETGLLNAREQAMTFVNALPPALRERIEPILWAKSPSGIYSLDDAAQAAERVELAQAYAAGMRGWAEAGPPKTKHASAHAASAADSSACYRCGHPGHQANRCPGTDSRCQACHKRGHTEAVCWTTHPELKPDWTSDGKSSGSQERGLSQRLDALAAQVEKLTLQMATLVQGRRVGNAHQAALPGPSAGSDDEGAGALDSTPAAYGALVGAAYSAQGAKHPMDAAFEDEEYKARCAEYDAYRAQREKEEEGRKWAEKLLDAWEERQLKRQDE
ncbi:hypothetical protein KFL_007020010 [Klebsormidium nitens]|uniref:CCHC-type domain-containing protein n=1 Tax=Klebsormidium nitens TaxID=105231 RepID=A0A1Y1IJF7_KLENI|nr:hypothetical protein KFL_007020010 [Klebsormidium nitens]|eukprot:GAQ90914.1 hypothetical protein KFL_007020010 [Klebsormidium nitens]